MSYKYEMGLNDHIQNSDEKVVLARTVGKLIRNNNIQSVLDIGAGEGTFASMVASQVPHYLAVEKRKGNADGLRDRGIEVIEQDFPLTLPQKFDMVLASHSMPSNKKEAGSFVENLIAATREDGTTCVITYKREKDDWDRFMNEVMGENWDKKDYDTYETLLDVFRHHGNVTVEKVDTNILGKNAETLFDALRFTYAGKDADLVELFNSHREKGVEWLEEYRRESNTRGYTFPFIQYVISVQKSPNAPSRPTGT